MRLRPRVFWPGAGILAIAGSAGIAGSPLYRYVDFWHFWAGGKTAGTPALVDPALHRAFVQAMGYPPVGWVYPAGAAWLFWPFSLVPLAAGFWLHAAVMALCVAVSGLLGARVFGLDRRVAVLAAFAWTPTMGSAILGQNAALALLMAMVALEGLRRDSDLLMVLGVGLLLYKPTLALPLLGLLLLRLRWRALAGVAAAAALWYLAGVAAAAGDWAWPARWLAELGRWYGADTSYNVIHAISTPGLLAGLGVPAAVALAAGVALAAASIPRLLRAPLLEAGAGALLVGLAVSPHANNWDAALTLPWLFWALGRSSAATGLAEPWRTRLIVGAALLAPEYLVSETVGFSFLAPIVLAGALVWILGLARVESRAASGDQWALAAPVASAVPASAVSAGSFSSPRK